MTQERQRKPRAKPDEGARQTERVMAAVKRARQARDWTAEQLAAEMAAVGVPWTRDTVVNLENSRRKHIALHEVTALAYVLGVQSPLDLLVPDGVPDHEHFYHEHFYPVTPTHRAAVATVRAWFLGKTGPLREWEEAAVAAGTPPLGDLAERLREQVDSGTMSQQLADDLIRTLATALRMATGGDDGEG